MILEQCFIYFMPPISIDITEYSSSALGNVVDFPENFIPPLPNAVWFEQFTKKIKNISSYSLAEQWILGDNS